MRLSPTKRSDLIRRLRSFGWVGPVSGGSHQHMVKGAIKLTIPNPHLGKEIGPYLLQQILSEAGISREEWLNAR
jgi:predicted RNA binding protein YcfA (HicA-like mRNA interferase family)